MRDSLTYLSCFRASPDTIELSLKFLLNVNVDSIDSNLSAYYYDLGWAYFFKAAYTKDNTYKDQSALAYFKCISVDSSHYSAYWNLALHYSETGECDLATKLMSRYKKYCPVEYYRHEEVEKVMTRCW